MLEFFSSLKNNSTRRAFHQKCNDILIVLVIVTFPISIKLSNYALFTLAFNWLIYVIHFKQGFFTSKWNSVLINIAPFLFSVVTLVYCKDLTEGLHNIEKFLPLIGFPVVVYTIQTRKGYKFFLSVFAFFILYMGIICFSNGLYNFLSVDESQQQLVGDFFNRVPGRWNELTNINLMRPFSINPIYMSLYVSFAFFVLLVEKFSKTLIKTLVLSFLVLFQFLIGSRIGLLAFFVSLFVMLIQIGSKQRRFSFSMMALLIFAGSVVLTFLNPVLKKRFITDVTLFNPPATVEQWNAINLRVAIWDCSWEVFRESPIIGYGVKSQEPPRDECYKEKYTFYGPYGTKLNSHNQYIEFALIGGVLLLGLFVVQLLYSFRLAWSKNDKIHLIFIVLFSVTCLGESVLETQKGLMFFALFNSLFIYYNGKETEI